MNTENQLTSCFSLTLLLLVTTLYGCGVAHVRTDVASSDLHQYDKVFISEVNVHSQEAARQVKEKGLSNDLLERIVADETFNLKQKYLDTILDISRFVGRAPQQVDEFLRENIEPLIVHSKEYGAVEKVSPTV